jgi:hypothetical protein
MKRNTVPYFISFAIFYLQYLNLVIWLMLEYCSVYGECAFKVQWKNLVKKLLCKFFFKLFIIN